MNLSKTKFIIVYSMILIIAGIANRLSLFHFFLPEYRALIEANPDWYTWQYLLQTSLSEHLFHSLLYLQQTPPIPNLIMGIFLKSLSFPVHVAYGLALLQAIIDIAASILLFLILCQIFKRFTWISFLISIIFLFHTDLVVMEYNSLGQTFYENLSMLFILAILFNALKFQQTPTQKGAFFIGLWTAVLALTRSAYSYFFFVPLLTLLVFPLNRKRQYILVYLIPVLLLQGSWGLKNYFVYDYFSVATTSWKGGNFLMGFVRGGREIEFKRFILSEPQHYPQWFIEMIKVHGLVHWGPPVFTNYVPQKYVKVDQAIQKKLNGYNRTENFLSQKVLFDTYMTAYYRYIQKYPDYPIQKFYEGYKIFWEPIRNYCQMYLSFFCIEKSISNGFNFDKILSNYFQGRFSEPQTLIQGNYFQGKSMIRVKYLTYHYFLNGFLVFNLIAVHLLIPVQLLVAGFFYLKNRNINLLNQATFFLFFIFVYTALVFNIPELGENMRFRLIVEPVIWILSTISMRNLIVSARSNV